MIRKSRHISLFLNSRTIERDEFAILNFIRRMRGLKMVDCTWVLAMDMVAICRVYYLNI